MMSKVIVILVSYFYGQSTPYPTLRATPFKLFIFALKIKVQKNCDMGIFIQITEFGLIILFTYNL